MSEPNKCRCVRNERERVMKQGEVYGVDDSACLYPALKAAHDEAVRKIQEEQKHLESDEGPLCLATTMGRMDGLRFALAALGVKEARWVGL